MTESRTSMASNTLQRISRDSVLGEFARPLPNLLKEGTNDVEASFDRLAELVGASKVQTTVDVTIADESVTRTWSITTGPEGCTVTNQSKRPADLEVIVDTKTWQQIASSALSPLEAFGEGRLRAAGDVSVALRIARQLRGRGE